MKGLDNYIMGTHDPNAPFNQVDIDDTWFHVLNAVNCTDDEYDKICDDAKTQDELERAFKHVCDAKFLEIQKLYAKEVAKEFSKIRSARLFADELTNQ